MQAAALGPNTKRPIPWFTRRGFLTVCGQALCGVSLGVSLPLPAETRAQRPQKGLLNVILSNGFINPGPLQELCGVLMRPTSI